MRKRDKYKIINYAINEYGKKFGREYNRANLSARQLENILKQHKHSYMCEWSYCCRGIYNNCWQDPFFDGNWGMTQKRVDEIILHTIRGLRKYCKRDNRIGICEKDGDIYVAIIARDLPGYAADYLIGFTNEED